MIDPAYRFSQKASNYARYRWDFSPEAIEAIFKLTGLSDQSSVADIGAGTGLLSQHFVSRVKAVYAVEPNHEMRQSANEKLASFPSYLEVDGFAEATTLAENSIDLITVGRAIHWFKPEESRREFLRIIKPEGNLAILRVPCVDADLENAVKSIRTAENGWNIAADKSQLIQLPLSFFFGSEDFVSLHFPATVTESWDEFLGRLSSISAAPGENHPEYPNYRNAAREIFQEYCTGEYLTVHISTELHLGHVTAG